MKVLEKKNKGIRLIKHLNDEEKQKDGDKDQTIGALEGETSAQDTPFKNKWQILIIQYLIPSVKQTVLTTFPHTKKKKKKSW